MTVGIDFSAEILAIDPAQITQHIASTLREIITKRLRRRGAVVGLSGGIDSSVVAALCVQALGKERVLGLLMPEADSSSDSLRLGRLLAESLGIRTVTEDITSILRGVGCYERRDRSIRLVVPGYDSSYKCKLVLPDLVKDDRYPVFYAVVRGPDGMEEKVRLTTEAYLGIVAATNFKQRTRKMLEYYYADCLHYAVAGTPNRLEYDQGFFVKLGDGAADVKPIAHLYKSQVYQLAQYLEVPEEIQQRPSTTDTYSLHQSQEEFYFSVPLRKLDLCLYAKNEGIAAADVAPAVELPAAQVERVYRMIDAKRKATRYLHESALLIEQVAEMHS
jgi:NAD+ synthase